jgi:PKD repeat protein
MRKLVCVGLILAGLALAPAASAATVQIGALAPSGTTVTGCTECATFQSGSDAAGPSYAVPVGDSGVITSWSVLGAPLGTTCDGSCDAELVVFRPTQTPNEYDFVGSSADETTTPNGDAQTFSTDIVVQSGDLIGLFANYNTPAYFTSAVPNDDVVADANSCTFTADVSCDIANTFNGSLMSVEATVQAPSALFTPSASYVTQGGSLNFDASASTSAGTITDYDWNFGDGTMFDAGATATTSHTYATVGQQTVSLTITDSNGDTNVASTSVTVLAPFAGAHLASSILTAAATGKVALQLACSHTAATDCRTTVKLYGTTGTVPAIATAHSKPATLLGSGTFVVSAALTNTEHLTLDTAGKKLLAKGSFAARAVVTAEDVAARSATTHVSVKVKLAAHHAAHGLLRALRFPLH